MKYLIIIFFFLASSVVIPYAQKNTQVDSLKEQITELRKQIEMMQNKYLEVEYREKAIIDNFSAQNSTIQTVSTIFAIFIAVVIFYAGWKTVRIESDHSKIIEEKNKMMNDFVSIRKDLNERLTSINHIENEFKKSSEEFHEEKQKIIEQLKNIVLENAQTLFQKTDESHDKMEENSLIEETKTLKNQIAEFKTTLSALEAISETVDPLLLYKKADVLFTAKQYAECRMILDKLYLKPDFDKKYLFKYAFSLKTVGEIEKAKKVYYELIEQEPTNAAALNNLGVLYKEIGENEKANQFYRSAWDAKKVFNYINNLINNTTDLDKIVGLYKEGLAHLPSDQKLSQAYRKILEANHMYEELLSYHQTEFNKVNNSGTFLNLLEVSVVARHDKLIKQLKKESTKYSFNSFERIMFNFICMIDQVIRGEEYVNILNETEILLDDKSVIERSWEMNLLDGMIALMNESQNKKSLSKIRDKIGILLDEL